MKQSAMAEKRHVLLGDIANKTASVLRNRCVSMEVAEQAGSAVADHLSGAWAGSNVCFPKDYRYKLAERDHQIASEFNGKNHRYLATRYSLNENTVYRVLKRFKSAMATKRHELMSDIADHTACVLRDHCVPADCADQAGSAVADHLSVAWAGFTVCFPRDYHYKLTQRDLQILSEFNGCNHHALAMKYSLTDNAIYKILKRVQERKFDRDQGKLDLGDGLI